MTAQIRAPLTLPTLDGLGVATQGELDAEAAARTAADALVIPLAQRAAANGVATLDASSKVPAAQLPADRGLHLLGSAEWITDKTTASFAAIDFQLGFQVLFDYTDRPILVKASLPYVYNSFASGWVIASLRVDGLEVARSATTAPSANFAIPLSNLERFLPSSNFPLAQGGHIAKLFWYVITGGTATALCSAGPAILEVWEV